MPMDFELSDAQKAEIIKREKDFICGKEVFESVVKDVVDSRLWNKWDDSRDNQR